MQAVCDFLLDDMRMPDEDLTVVRVEKIHAKRTPDHRKASSNTKEGMVRAVFKTIHKRDLVVSYASQLKRGSNIDVVVPDHLLSLKRHLESYAYKMRVNVRQDNTKVSTSIRLQDQDLTLILAVKGEDGVWKYLSLNDLKSLEEAAKDRSESGDSSGGEEYDCLLYTSPSPRDS